MVCNCTLCEQLQCKYHYYLLDWGLTSLEHINNQGNYEKSETEEEREKQEEDSDN